MILHENIIGYPSDKVFFRLSYGTLAPFCFLLVSFQPDRGAYITILF